MLSVMCGDAGGCIDDKDVRGEQLVLKCGTGFSTNNIMLKRVLPHTGIKNKYCNIIVDTCKVEKNKNLFLLCQ